MTGERERRPSHGWNRKDSTHKLTLCRNSFATFRSISQKWVKRRTDGNRLETRTDRGRWSQPLLHTHRVLPSGMTLKSVYDSEVPVGNVVQQTKCSLQMSVLPRGNTGNRPFYVTIFIFRWVQVKKKASALRMFSDCFLFKVIVNMKLFSWMTSMSPSQKNIFNESKNRKKSDCVDENKWRLCLFHVYSWSALVTWSLLTHLRLFFITNFI